MSYGRQRTDTQCGAVKTDGSRCPAMRHRICKECGTGNLLNEYGFLVDHVTGVIHACGNDTDSSNSNDTRNTETVPVTNPSPSVMRHDPLAEIIADAVRDHVLTDSTIESRISDIADRIVKAAVSNIEIERQSINVTVTRPNDITYEAGSQHVEFARLCNWIISGTNVMLVGDTGTGKTYGATEAAKALGITPYPFSCGPTTQPHDLIGFMSVDHYSPGIAFKPFTEGGLLILDEMDAASPEAMVVLNAMLANDMYAFPHGVFKRHPEFRVVAAANTYGTGATREYVGRQQLDAATLNRFTFLDWDYDQSLEQTILNGWIDAYPQHESGFRDWANRVQSVRRIIRELSIRQSASTRDMIEGFKLVTAGENIDRITYARLFARMGNDANKIKASL